MSDLGIQLLVSIAVGAFSFIAAFAVFVWANFADTHRRQRHQIIEACDRMIVLINQLRASVLQVSNTAHEACRYPPIVNHTRWQSEIDALAITNVLDQADEVARVAFAHSFDELRSMCGALLNSAQASQVEALAAIRCASDLVNSGESGLAEESGTGRSRSENLQKELSEHQAELEKWCQNFSTISSHLKTELLLTQRTCTQQLEIHFAERIRSLTNSDHRPRVITFRDEHVLRALDEALELTDGEDPFVAAGKRSN